MQTEQQIDTIVKTKKTSVKKEKKTKDQTSTVQDQTSTVQDQSSIVQDQTSTVQDQPSTVQEQSVTVQEQTSSKEDIPVQDNITTEQSISKSVEIFQTNDVVNEYKYTLDDVIEFTNSTSDRLLEYGKLIKDTNLSKEDRSKVEGCLKKLQKSYNSFQSVYFEKLSREVSNLEKNTGNKSSGKTKVQDKEKAAIHKKLSVYPFLLKFMNLEQGTLVSRSDALTAITGYVKQEKEKNPDIILESDKRSFKLIGDLKVLFDGIKQVMQSKNLLENKQMPTEIKYTQIMEYMTHCFIKNDDSTVSDVTTVV